MQTNLDMDCLRTFATIIETGSFAGAAARIGRTAAAVSLQIGRLEAQIGAKLFNRSGRRMLPSPDGERLLATTRKILDLNDDAVESLRFANLAGEIRLGAIQDVADAVLPAVLSRFRAAHPRVRLSVRVERSGALVEAVAGGTLDIAVGVHGIPGYGSRKICGQRMAWFGWTDAVATDVPVPLVAFAPPCGFRDAAITALEAAGRPWEIVFTSPSLSGLRAAVAAGLGVTARTRLSFPGLPAAEPGAAGLPALPRVEFGLYARNDLAPPAARIADIVVDELRGA